jgi:signal peptidase I
MNVTLIAVASLATAAVLCLTVRRAFVVAHVSGDSMLPTLKDQDRVLVSRLMRNHLRVGSIIVLRSPLNPLPPPRWPFAPPLSRSPWVIKRIAALPGDTVPAWMPAATDGPRRVPPGKLLVTADNPTGHDSRQWGFIGSHLILGRVIRTLWTDAKPAAPGSGTTVAGSLTIGTNPRRQI